MHPLFHIVSGTISTLHWSNKIKIDAVKASFDNKDEIIEPLYNVSIMMPSYNEESLIEYALKSIKEQNIIKKYPKKFELVLVDSDSIDNTVKIAKNYVDKIVYTPRGKLTSRNLSLPHLNGEIIVSVDADCYYPVNWLNLMLKYFNDKDVVAVEGFTLDELPQYGKLVNKLYPLMFHIEHCAINKNRLSGRCSAYYKHLQYLEPFNENINQFDVNEMVKEEEIGFGNRLSKYGRVIFNNRACCLHLGSVKVGCRYGYNPQNEVDKLYCEEIRNKERF